MTEEGVEAAEEKLAGAPPALPDSLRDPGRVFTGATAPAEVRPLSGALPPSSGHDESLAHAAREAGHLSPEVLERMRADRERAEAEALDEDDDGEDAGQGL